MDKGKSAKRGLRALLWVVPVLGGMSGLCARTGTGMPHAVEAAMVTDRADSGLVDTTKKAGRPHVDVADGPNVYRININVGGAIMFNGIFVDSASQLQKALYSSLLEHYVDLKKAHWEVGPFTLHIVYDAGYLEPGMGTKEADLQAAEQAVREGVRQAVEWLSRMYPPNEVRKVLRLNMTYGTAGNTWRETVGPPPPSKGILDTIMLDIKPTDTIIGQDTLYLEYDTIVVKKGQRLLLY